MAKNVQDNKVIFLQKLGERGAGPIGKSHCEIGHGVTGLDALLGGKSRAAQARQKQKRKENANYFFHDLQSFLCV